MVRDTLPLALWVDFLGSRKRKIAILGVPVTSLEVKHALFSMGVFKAPSPDGYQAIFFSKSMG